MRTIKLISREFSKLISTVIDGFNADFLYARASALSFYTLLSVVPLLAVAFGVATGFGFQNALEKQILETFAQHKELATKVIEFAHSLLEHTRGNVIAGVGVILLLWSAYSLLGNFESTLNAIWKVDNPRNFMRKLSDYLALLILFPILFVASTSLTAYIVTTLAKVAREGGYIDVVHPLLLWTFHFLNLVLSWILFTVIYIFIPNTKVNYKIGILTGIIAGTSFYIAQWFYIHFQIGVNSYGAIYGSLAALPLFLIFVQMSWMITLLGAELGYQLSRHNYDVVSGTDRVNASEREIAVFITAKCVNAFRAGLPPVSVGVMTQELGISQEATRVVVDRLVNERVLSRIQDNDNGYHLQPAKDSITLSEVCEAMDTSKDKTIPILKNGFILSIQQDIENLEDSLQGSQSNLLIRELFPEIKE